MASSLSLIFSVLLASSLVLGIYSNVSEAGYTPPLVKGLSWTFYQSNCPHFERIVRRHLTKVFERDIHQAGGLLRLQFHDCFVRGCDGSVLLDGSASGPTEQMALPNLSLRAEAFQIINDLRALVHHKCGQVVSCTDIIAVAARDSVFLSGGPEYKVPFGRRDGVSFATREATLADLPPPTSNTTTLLARFATMNFDATNLVALLGGHTIGRGHCASFTNRLYPTQDTTMDKTFANNLKKTCPTSNTNATAVLDTRTPNRFDNKYYIDLMNRQGLFTSDQDLYMDSRTKPIVTRFVADQALFFEKFAFAMIKMGQLSVLTGTRGEVRANCSATNSGTTILSTIEDDREKSAQF